MGSSSQLSLSAYQTGFDEPLLHTSTWTRSCRGSSGHVAPHPVTAAYTAEGR